MAQLLNVTLPAGWVRSKYDVLFQNVLLEKSNGGVEIQQNWPRALWQMTASYNREAFEGDFDQLLRFYLNTGAACAFDVEDPLDHTHNSGGASGHVVQVTLQDGSTRWQLVKRYPFGSGYYERVIYRPTGTITLGGGATGGTVNMATGEVTGISAAGTWSGAFKIPMIFAAPLSYETAPEGLVKAVSVLLREDPLI